MVMHWNGEKIVDLSREFLNTNGAVKQMHAKVQKCGLSDCFARKNCPETGKKAETSFAERLSECVSDINICSRQGLAERFDSTIGAATVLMPFGGKNMLTPTQAMAAKLPVRGSETDTCSVMAYGFDPHYSAGRSVRRGVLRGRDFRCQACCGGCINRKLLADIPGIF